MGDGQDLEHPSPPKKKTLITKSRSSVDLFCLGAGEY
jgi:hypothetical protein